MEKSNIQRKRKRSLTIAYISCRYIRTPLIPPRDLKKKKKREKKKVKKGNRRSCLKEKAKV